MTMSDAAKQVLEAHANPMTISEIYDEIIKKELYKFGAKNPKGVLSQAIRERSTANEKAKIISLDNKPAKEWKLNNL